MLCVGEHVCGCRKATVQDFLVAGARLSISLPQHRLKSTPCLKHQRMKPPQGRTGIFQMQILILGRMVVEKGAIV